jgi:hypothetical protein
MAPRVPSKPSKPTPVGVLRVGACSQFLNPALPLTPNGAEKVAWSDLLLKDMDITKAALPRPMTQRSLRIHFWLDGYAGQPIGAKTHGRPPLSQREGIRLPCPGGIPSGIPSARRMRF